MTDEEESLSEAFWAVGRQLRNRNRNALNPWDVTPSQARALAMLLRHGTIRLRDLAEHLRIVPRSATEVVDGLQERGLVERSADPSDRRVTLVGLTGPGTEVATAIRAARAAEAEGLFAELSERDRADLARVLRTLRRGS